MARSNWRLERVYGTTAGTRFAAVTYLPTAQRVDVRIRGSADGKILNAWGDAYPTEETRRPQIYAMADKMYAEARYGKNPKRRTRKNPDVVTLRNPAPRGVRRVGLLSERVIALQYLHKQDNRRAYEHKFKRGVCCELLSDGSVRLYRTDGRKLWGDFD